MILFLTGLFCGSGLGLIFGLEVGKRMIKQIGQSYEEDLRKARDES